MAERKFLGAESVSTRVLLPEWGRVTLFLMCPTAKLYSSRATPERVAPNVRQYLGLLPSMLRLLLGAMAVACATPQPVAAVQVTCSWGGDQFGWWVASGGDFDGDATPDIAVGAPCATVRGLLQAGRATVYSGADGHKIITVKGIQAFQRFGSAVEFVSDIDGDGKDELVVGSSGWDDEDLGRANAGRVDVYNASGQLLTSTSGEFSGGNLGEALGRISDASGDGTADIIAGAARATSSGLRRGEAYLISGADGSILDRDAGDNDSDRWGTIVGRVEDLDGDGIDEVLVGSGQAMSIPNTRTSVYSLQSTTTTTVPTTTTPLVNTGVVKILSGASFDETLVVVSGAKDDRLGRAAASIGDVTNDGLADVLVGSPGAIVSGKNKSGKITLFSATAEVVAEYVESSPQIAAALGTAIAKLDDIDGDDISDFAASAPGASIGGAADIGRVTAFSTDDPSTTLWSVSGEFPGARFGRSLSAGVDLNNDLVADLLVGAPGDTARGRRGAGTVRVLDGITGDELRCFKGRRGRESRLFALGWDENRRARLVSYNRRGRRRGLNDDVFRRLVRGQMSVAIANETSGNEPDTAHIIMGTGVGGSEDLVIVVAAGPGRRKRQLSELEPFTGGYNSGVTVAAGNIIAGDNEELVVAQADVDTGNAFVRIYEQNDEDPFGRLDWLLRDDFTAFNEETEIEGMLVNAGGAYVAVGEVHSGSGANEGLEEIVVGPTSGAPLVRVFNASGTVVAEWLAYPAATSDGTRVVTGDLDGDGTEEIVTVPDTGEPRVKAWSGDGSPFTDPATGRTVNFFVQPLVGGSLEIPEGGLQLAIADFDLDGRGEILVAGVWDSTPEVRVFELDGSASGGWARTRPFGSRARLGFAVVASDRFIRH